MVFEGSGHFPHNEEPEAFGRIVTEFLETTEPLVLDDDEWRAVLTAGPLEAASLEP